MVIKKILNNNAVVCMDVENNIEIIALGKGVGFDKKTGEIFNEQFVDKVFVNKNSVFFKTLKTNITNLSEKYIIVTQNIISYASDILNKKFNDNLYVNLINHLQFAIERSIKNIPIINSIFWEIKRYYPDEFLVGKQALKFLKNEFGIELEIEEASFIAIHLIDADLEHDHSKVLEMTELIDGITKIVKYQLGVKISNNENANKFISHIRYMIMNIVYNNPKDNNFKDIYNVLSMNHPEVYSCTLKIKNYIKSKFSYDLSNDEITYLMIHLIKLTSSPIERK